MDAVEQAKAAKRKANAASKFQELLQKSHNMQSKGAGSGVGSNTSAAVPAKLAPSAPISQEHRPLLSQKRSRHNPDAVWLHSRLLLFSSLCEPLSSAYDTTH